MKSNLKVATTTTRETAAKTAQVKARPVVDMLTGEGTGLFISTSES